MQFGNYNRSWEGEDENQAGATVRPQWYQCSTLPTLSQFRSFIIRRPTFLNDIKFADFLIFRLRNCERVGRVLIYLLASVDRQVPCENIPI